MAAPAPARPPGGSTELIIGFRDGVFQAEQYRASNVTVGSSTSCTFVLSVKGPDGVTIGSRLFGTNGGTLPVTPSAAGFDRQEPAPDVHHRVRLISKRLA